jgi:hypothetical protein
MDNTPDLDTLPTGFDVPSTLTADTSNQPQATDAEQLLQFPFCLLFNGKPWTTIVVAAPSPDLAALTMEQYVQLINAALVNAHYPPNMCTARSGSC